MGLFPQSFVLRIYGSSDVQGLGLPGALQRQARFEMLEVGLRPSYTGLYPVLEREEVVDPQAFSFIFPSPTQVWG